MAYMYYIQHNQNTLMKQNTKHKTQKKMSTKYSNKGKEGLSFCK